MYFSRPVQWYHSHADPIYGTFKSPKLYSLAETRNIAPHLGSNTRALLVSQDRRHFFVTPDLCPQKYAK